MKDRETETKVEYLEVTEKRYNYVKTRFKYMSYRNNEKHYHLARNRAVLEDML